MAGPNKPLPKPEPYLRGRTWIVPRSRHVLDLMEEHGSKDPNDAERWSDLLQRDPAHESDVAPTMREGKGIVEEDFSDLLTTEQKAYGFRGDRSYLEEQRAQNQGATGRLTNAAIRFIPGVGIKTAQGLAYSGAWLADTYQEYLGTGEDPKTRYEGSLIKKLDNAENALASFLPIHQRQAYKEGGFWNTLTSSEFVAGEVAQGLEFLGSMATSANVLNGILGAGKLGSSIAVATSAAGEAGFEAKGTYDSIKVSLEGKKNPQTGKLFTNEEIDTLATESANRVFNTTIWLHAGTNALQLKMLTNAAFSKNIDKIRKDIVAGKTSAETIKAGRQAFSNGMLGIWSEGFVEENLQTSISLFEEDMAKQGISQIDISGYFNKWLEGAIGFGKAAAGYEVSDDQKEQYKAILAGSLIGGVPAAKSGYADATRNKVIYETLNEDFKRFSKDFQIADKNFFGDRNAIYKEFEYEVDELDANDKPTGKKVTKKDIINPVTGKPEIDLEVARKMWYQTIWDKQVFDRHTAITMDGDERLATFNQHLALAGLAYQYDHLYTSDSWGKMSEKALEERMAGDPNKELTPEEQKEIESMKSQVREYRTLKQSIDKKYTSKDELSTDPSTAAFAKEYKRIMFYEQVKLRAYEAMKNNNLTKKDRETLDTMITDTENFIDKLENEKGEFKKFYIESLNPVLGQKDKIAAIEKKIEQSVDPDEKLKLMNEKINEDYILKEMSHIESDFNPATTTGRRFQAKNLRFGSKDNAYYEMGMAHKTQMDFDEKVQDLDSLKQTKDNAIANNDPNPQQLEDDYSNKQAQALDLLASKKGMFNEETITQANELIDNITQEQQDMSRNLNEVKAKHQDSINEIERIKNSIEVDVDAANKINDSVAIISEGLTEYFAQSNEQIKDIVDKNSDPLTADKNELLGALEQLVIANDPSTQDELGFILDAAIENAGGDSLDSDSADKLEYLKDLLNIEATVDPEINKQIQAETVKQDALKQEIDSLDKKLKNKIGLTQKSVSRASEAISRAKQIKNNIDKNNLDKTLQRDYLNMFLDQVESQQQAHDADPSFYDELDKLMELKTTLIAAKEVWANRTPASVVTRIESALEDIDLLIEASKANKGTRGAKLKEFEAKEANENLALIGLDLEGNVTNPVLNSLIVESIPNANDIIIGATSPIEKSTAVRIILDLFKMQATDVAKKQVLEKLEADKTSKIAEIEKEHTDQGITINRAYYGTPVGMFRWTLMSDAINILRNIYVGDLEGKNPLFIFDETGDINELEKNISDSKLLTDVQKSAINNFIRLHKEYLSIFNAINTFQSPDLFHKNHEQESALLEELSDKNVLEVPTSEQLPIIRALMSFLRTPITGQDRGALSKVWSFLAGPAGAGKTRIVLNWVSRIYDVPKERIYAFSHNENTSKGIADSINGKQGMVSEFISAYMNFDQYDLIVIDELPFFMNPQIKEFEERVFQHNKTRKGNPLRVISLGDPGQIRKDRGATLSTPSVLSEMNYTNPLTLTYRSNVSAIVNLMNQYRRKVGVVENIKVQSNALFGTKFDANKPTIGVHSGKTLEDVKTALNANKDSGRSKVIVVNTEADKAKYASETNVEVLTYDEVQGMTFDEVYVDMNRSGKDLRGETFANKRNDLEFNTAMYTALSRAKSYIFVLDPSMENLYPDPSLAADTTKLTNELKENAEKLRERLEAESALLIKYIKDYKPTEHKKKKPRGNNDILDSEDPSIIVEEDPDGTIEPEVGDDLVIATGVKENENDPSTDLNSEAQDFDEANEQAKLDDLSKGGGKDIPPMNDDLVKDPHDNFFYSILFPESAQLKNNPNTRLPDVLPEGIDLGNGRKSVASPVILARDIDGKILVLGQIQFNGVFTNKWKQVGIIGQKDKESKFYQKFARDTEAKAISKGDYIGYNKDTNEVSNIRMNVDSTGRFVDAGNDNSIVFIGSMTASNPVTYIFGEVPETKGFIQSVLEKFRAGFSVKGFNYSIKIYDRKTINSDTTVKASGFNPRPGVPYLVITDPEGNTSAKAQFIRLSPRKLNTSDLAPGGFLRPLRELYQAARDLGIFIFPEDPNKALGDVAVNTIIKKMANAKDVNGERAYDLDANGKVILNRPIYTYKDYLNDVSKGYAEFAGTKISEEQFDKIQEAAKKIIPLYYGKRHRKVELELNTPEEIEAAAKKLENTGKVLFKAKTSEESKFADNLYYIKNAAQTKNDKDSFEVEMFLAAGAGAAQKVMNQLAAANNQFKFRQNGRITDKKSGKTNKVVTSKNIMSTTTSAAKYIEGLSKIVQEHYISKQERLGEKVDPIKLNKYKTGTRKHLENYILKHQVPQELIDQLKAEESTSPISLQDLENIVGDTAFVNNEHRTIEGQYLTLPLGIISINKQGSNLQDQASVDYIESVMGSKVQEIKGGTVVISKYFVEGKKEDITEETSPQETIVRSSDRTIENYNNEVERVINNINEINATQDTNDLSNKLEVYNEVVEKIKKTNPVLYSQIKENQAEGKFKETLELVTAYVKNNKENEVIITEDSTLEEEVALNDSFDTAMGRYYITDGKYYLEDVFGTVEEISEDDYNAAKIDSGARNFIISDSEDLGREMSTDDAIKLAKKLLPKLKIGKTNWLKAKLFSMLGVPISNEVELKFLDKLEYDALVGRTDSLGVYINGTIYLLKDSQGNVREGVLRHEVVHKVYMEYLSPKDRKALRRSAARTNPSTISMNQIQFEEWMANEFMKYKDDTSTQQGRIKQFFSNLLRLAKFITGNRGEITDLFNSIEKGYFRRNMNDFSTAAPRYYIEIKQNFESAKIFKEAVLTVQTHFSALLDVDEKDHTKKVYTYNEAYHNTKYSLLNLKASKEKRLAKYIDIYDKAKSDNDTAKQEKAQKLIDILNKDLQVFDAIFKDGKDKNYDIITYYLFPDGFTKQHRDTIRKRIQEEDINDVVDLDSETLSSDLEIVNVQDVIAEAKNVDQEAKQSSAVKLMLSNIKDPSTGEWIIPRLAFAKCLKFMESMSFEEEEVTLANGHKKVNTFLTRFKEAIITATGIKEGNMAESGAIFLVYEKLKQYYNSALNPQYNEYSGNTFTKKRKLPHSIFFLNPDVLVISRDFADNEDYRGLPLNELQHKVDTGKVFIFSRLDAEKILTESAIEKGNKGVSIQTEKIIEALETIIDNKVKAGLITNFTEDTNKLTRVSMVREAWRSQQSKNALAEFYSLFASMMEEHMMIANYDVFENRTTYVKAGANSNSLSVKSDIQQGLITRLTTLTESLNGDAKRAYKAFTSGTPGKGYITWGEIESKLLNPDVSVKVQGIKEFLQYININVNAAELNIKDASRTAEDIYFFVTEHMSSVGDVGKSVYDSMSKEDKENLSDEDKAELSIPSEVTIYDVIEEQGSLIDRIAKEVSSGTKWVRPNSVKDSGKKTVYLFHNSTQANDILIAISKLFSGTFKGGGGILRTIKLPAHLKQKIFAKGNIFVTGLNKIHDTYEHDGTVDIVNDKAISYTKESKSKWFSRTLNASMAFMINTSRQNYPRYIQWVYTISNKPRITGAGVDFLSPNEIKEALGTYLVKVSLRPDLEGIIKNYKKYNNNNFEIFDKVANGIPMSELISKSVQGDQLTSYGKEIVNKMYDELTNMSKEFASELQYDQFKFDARFMQAVLRLKKEGKLDESIIKGGLKINSKGEVVNYAPNRSYNHTVEDIHGAVDMMFKNMYVNSYFLTELVAGDSNFFKDALDLVKRMSGAFGPGMKGLVHDKLGMKKQFTSAVISDVVEGKDSISNSVSKMLYKKAPEELSKTEKEEFDEIIKLFGNKYESTDGQGFMLPEMAAEIEKGFGRAFKAGHIFKAAHYEQVVKKFTKDGNEFEAVIPVMEKYSIVNLSDDLCTRFPSLGNMRTNMRLNASGKRPIYQVVFASATKVGGPIKTTNSKQLLTEDGVFTEESIYDLSYENLRMQSNPDHITFDSEKGVANPSQLGYMILLQEHLLAEGDVTAKLIHTYTSKAIEKGANKFKNRITDENGKFSSKKLLAFIKDAMTGKGNERYHELLSDGVSFQAPYIVNKALTQIAASLTKSSVGFRLPGEKLILQTDFGITAEILSKFRPLEFAQSKDKSHLEAEVIFPEGVLPKDVEDNIKQMIKSGNRFYATSDMLGFRIPSTELHSAVAIKIAGFYDSRGTNAIIAPKELVVLHGSDFDVDSLFMLTRSYFKPEEAELFGVNPHTPIGYELKKNEYHTMTPSKFEDLIAKLRETHKDDPKKLKVIDKVEDKFFTNVITQGFIDMVLKPENRARMVEPISMEIFNGTGEKTMFTMLSNLQKDRHKYLNKDATEEELAEAGEVQARGDLSNPSFNYKVFKSSMDGAALVGVFANGFKSLAYMLNSGEAGANNIAIKKESKKLKEAIKNQEKLLSTINEELLKLDKSTNPNSVADREVWRDNLIESIRKSKEVLGTLKEKLKVDKNEKSSAPFLNVPPIKLLGKLFDRVREFEINTDWPVWRTLDALVNSAIDNVKEQILVVINASGLTSNAVVALTGLGVPIRTTVLLMRQPVIDQMNSTGFKKSEVKYKKEALQEMFQKTTSFGSKEEAKEALSLLELYASELVLTDAELERAFIEDNIDFKGFLNLGTDEALKSVKDPFKSLVRQYAILLEVEKAMNIGDDISVMSSALNIIRQFPSNKSDMSDTEDKWKQMFKENKEGELESVDAFSFNIPNLFNANAHIKSAYETFKYLVNAIETMFLKHDKNLTALAKKIVETTSLSVGTKNETIEAVKNDFVKFIATGIPSMVNIPLTLTKEFKNVMGVKDYTTGPEAWSLQFIEKLDDVKNFFKNNNIGNGFLENIAIRPGRFDTQYVQFTAGNNLKAEDYWAFQEAFKLLDRVEFDAKGNISLSDTPVPNYTEFQRDFVRFAILNFGLQFGSTNYSTSLPGDLVKPFMDELDQELAEALLPDNLEAYRELFEVQTVLERSKSIGDTRKKPTKVEVTQGTWRSAAYDTLYNVYYNLRFDLKPKETIGDYIKFGKNIFKKIKISKEASTEGTLPVFFTKIGSVKRRVSHVFRKELAKKYTTDLAFDSSVLSRAINAIDGVTKITISDNYYKDIKTKEEHGEGSIIMLYATSDGARMQRKYYTVTKKLTSPKTNEFGINEMEFEIAPIEKKEMDQYLDSKGEDYKLAKKVSKVELNYKDANSSITKASRNQFISVEDILRDIQVNGSTAGKLIANLLLTPTFAPAIKGLTTRTIKAKQTERADGSSVIQLGYWDPNYVKEISIAVEYEDGTRVSQDKIESTLLHELMHAVTSTILHTKDSALSRDQVKAKANLNKLFVVSAEAMKKKYKDKFVAGAGQFYGFTNIDEFVAEAFSNPEFQAELDSFKIDNKKQSLLTKFKDFFLRLFGVVENDSLLAQVMNNTFYLIDNPINRNSVLVDSNEIFYKVDNSKPTEPEGLTKKILDMSRQLLVAKDSEGNELDHYTLSINNAKLNRVTDNFTGFISKFISFTPKEKGLSSLQIKADRVFAGIKDDQAISIDGIAKKVTKAEYKQWLDDINYLGIIKGKISHKWLELLSWNKYSKKTKEQLDSELDELLDESIVDDPIKTYGWIEHIYDKLLDKLQINALNEDIPEDKRDKIFSEVTVGSELLGFAGTMDMFVEHADGSYSIIDWKTGRNVEKEVHDALLKFGNQFDHMFDDPKTRNQLQVMFYAFMLKVENPDMMFRDLAVMWIPNKYEALAYDPKNKANHANFLRMIEQYYKTEDIKSYHKIKEKSPNAFNPKHYNATDATLAGKMLSEGKSAEQVLINAQNELKWKIQSKLDKRQMTSDDLDEIKRLTQEIVAFAKMEGYDIQNWSEDISFSSRWLGINADVNHPIINLYNAKLNEALDKSNKEFTRDMSKFDRLMKAVNKEYLEKNTPNTGFLRKITLKKIDPSTNAVFEPFFTTYENDGVTLERFLHNNEKDPDKKRSYDLLSPIQKEFIDYVNERFASPFVGENAFLHRTAVKNRPNMVGMVEMGVKDLSDLELYNLNKGLNDRFEYSEGFIPTVAPTMQDIKERYSDSFKDYIKYVWNKHTTYSTEMDYEQWGNREEAIPIKYLGTRSLRANKMYSRNIENMFDRYMRAMYHKKHGDDVHALIKGMQIVAIANTEKGDKSDIAKYLDEHISLELYHKTEDPFDLTKRPLLSPTGGKYARKFSVLKYMQAARASAGAALMWVKPHKALQNAAIASLFSVKEGLMGEFIALGLDEKGKGIDSSIVDFTVGDLIKASGIVATFIGDQIQGNYQNNKLWRITQELRFDSNAYELATNSRYLETLKTQLLSPDVAYMLHTLPEEFISKVIMVAQLNRMKFTSGDIEGKSMWDAYQMKVDPITGENNLDYVGPTRGYTKVGNKIEKVGRITSKEAAKMRYVYTRIQGGYRSGEKTSIEFYAIGQAIIQFKKHLPQLLKTNFGSLAKSNVLGKYEVVMGNNGKPVTIKDENGKEISVIEWQSRITEGRWRTLAGFIGEFLHLNDKIKGTSWGSKILSDNSSYRWENLAPEQRKNMLEAGMAMASMITLWLWYGWAFGDDDEEDSMKKMASYILDTYGQNYNPIDIYKNISTFPSSAAATRTYKTMSAGNDLGWAMWASTGWSPFNAPDDAVTTKGDYKGWAELQRGIPLMSSYYEFSKWLKNLDVGDESYRYYK